jgi:hypothetical protein
MIHYKQSQKIGSFLLANSSPFRTFEKFEILTEIFRAFVPEVLDDVIEADVRADDATEKSENKNPGIFYQPPFELVGIVPV